MSMALELDSKAHAHFSFSQSFLFLNPPKRKKMNKMPVNPPSWRNDTVLPLPNEVIANAWAVDAACSGNPGPMEYQCIDLQTGAQVFHYGPIHGTNNIGEFLAIVHALALMQQKGITDKIIYSDSVNAQLWVSKKQCKTKLSALPKPNSSTRSSPEPRTGSAPTPSTYLL